MPVIQGAVSLLVDAGYRILIAAIILAVGWLVGRAIGFAVRKLTASIGADSVFRKTAIGRSIIKSGYTASTFSEYLARWLVYIAAILIALQSLNLPLVSSAVMDFLTYLPTLAAGIIMMIVGFVLSDWFGEFLKKGIPQEQREAFYLDLAADLSKIVLYFVTVTIVLREMGVDVTILYIVGQAMAWGVAIAMGVIVGIVVGWMLKDRIKTVLS